MRILGMLLTALTICTPAVSAQHEFHRGNGDDVIRITRPEAAPALLLISGNGPRSNFSVWAINGSGRQTDLLVNTVDRYRGSVLSGSDTEMLEINAEGSWTVAVFAVGQRAHRLGRGESVSGEGDDVLWLRTTGTGGTIATVSGNSARENFAVWALNPGGQRTALLVNTIDRYNGRVRVPTGTRLLAVSAVGNWVVSLN